MKKLIFVFILSAFVLTSCDLIDFNSKSESSSSIGGSTNIPLNTVGNSFSPAVSAGGKYYYGSATITSVTDGVATVKFQAALPGNVSILQNIKSKYKDAYGNLSCEGKFKMTDEGILDYNNIDHEPFVLVKYDAKVGDTYTLKKSDGTSITREVVRKSSSDDFYWGGMLIKTTDVEQSSNIPGVEKIVYYTNHKFGLVAVQVYLEDGTSSWMYLNPSSY